MSAANLVPRDEPLSPKSDVAGSVGPHRTTSAAQEDLSRYVAIHVRHLYEQRKGEPLKEPLMLRSNFAVVAMADVSGYSHLTNHLKNRHDGAELLTELLNPYFHFVIDIIEKSGGDVVKFIGDAILVKWELKDQSKAECVALACSGCLRLLERLGNHILTIPTDRDDKLMGGQQAFPLSMHIGLGVGEAYDMHMGSARHQRWEYFLEGKALDEAVHLVNVANQRELVISNDTLICMQGEAAILQAGIKGITTEKKKDGYILKSLKWLGENDGLLGFGREKDAFPPKPVYRQYINESAAERLIAGHFSLINELRKLTVMFARFSASDVGTDEGKQQYQKAMTGTLDVIRTYEGTLRQMVTDDKGTSILIVFGLPPLSHENDALFGLRAALELRRLLSGLFADYSISVTTGTVFSGVVGGRTRADHTIMGEVVNLAARLMISDMCSNAIYCDRETKDACVSDIYFDDEPIEFVTKKGKAIVHKVMGLMRESINNNGAVKSNAAILKQKTMDRTGSDSVIGRDYAPTFIGREKEIETIAKCITEFLTSDVNPPRIFIEGDGGTGKSSMFSHTVDHVSLNALPCCVAKGDEVDHSTPLFVFRDLILDLIDLIHEELPSQDDGEDGSLGIKGTERDANGNEKANDKLEITKSISGEQIPDLLKQMRSSKSYQEMELTGAPGSTVRKKSGRSRSLYRSIRISGVAVERMAINASVETTSDTPVRTASNVSLSISQQATAESPQLESTSSNETTDASKSMSPHNSIESDENDQRTSMLLGRIRSALDKVGVPKTLASTLALIFTVGDIGRIDYNVVTSAIAPKGAARHNRARASSAVSAQPEKLTKLDALAELLAKMINIVTVPPKAPKSGAARTTPLFPNGLVFAIDDAQWIDGLSWTLLYMLARRCPRLLLIFAMRPLARNVPEPCARMQASAEAHTITLGGLSKEAVSRIIVNVYGEQVKTVQERLLEAIMEKTGGNPLFVMHIARGLKNQRNLAVSPSFELFAKGRQGLVSELDTLVPKDLQSAMLVQFDRIDPTLQLILRVASVVGNTFLVEMVASIMHTDRGIGLRECYDYLTSAEAMLFVGFESSNPDQYSPENVVMLFKSALLQKCVYSTMLVSERSKVHSMVAQMYEAQLNDDNRQQYLPIILYHYERTNNMFKRIRFLEGMAEIHMSNGLHADAAVTLKKLLNSLPMLEADKKTIITNDRRSHWHKSLGQSYVNIYDWELGKGHLLESLRYMDVHMPPNKNALRWATVKLLTKQRKYWSKRNQLDREPEITDYNEIQRTVSLSQILAPLAEAFIYLSAMDEATWCTITRLNLCEALGETTCAGYDLHFARVIGVVALSLYMGHRTALSMEYFQRAEQIANRSEDPVDLIYTHLFRAIAHFSSGNAKEAMRYLDINLQLIEVNGVRSNDTIVASMTLDLLSGQFAAGMARARELYNDSIDHSEDVINVFSACYMVFFLNLSPSLSNGDNEVENWFRTLLNTVSASMRQLGTSGAFLALSAVAYHSAMRGDWSKMLECLDSIASTVSNSIHPSLTIVYTHTIMLLGQALLQWHREGCPLEADFQANFTPPVASLSNDSEENAFSSALSAAGMPASSMDIHAQTMVKTRPSQARDTDDIARASTQSWGASVGDRALKKTFSRESFDGPPLSSPPRVRALKASAAMGSPGHSPSSSASTASGSLRTSAPPSPGIQARLGSEHNGSPNANSGKRLYMMFVNSMAKVIKSMKKEWYTMGMLSHVFDALEQLERSSSTEKTSILFEKAVLAVPQGLSLAKLMFSIEALRFASPPKGKKAILDRRKRLDELSEQARSLSLPQQQAHLASIISKLPPL